ncbi:MAG: dTMP kinase [Myxococcota bacterium]
MPGRLIVVEGLDGTGKTTLSVALARALGAEWTTTPGQALRAVRADVERHLGACAVARQAFYAATVLAESARVGAWLDAGRDVVVDRYWCSTLAYAAARGQSADLAALEAHVRPADVTLFLTLDERERAARLRARGLTDLDAETLSPLRSQALLALFRTALARPCAGRVVELDVTGRDPEEVLADARAATYGSSAPALFT